MAIDLTLFGPVVDGLILGFFMARPSCYSPGMHDQSGNVTALKKIESPRRGAA